MAATFEPNRSLLNPKFEGYKLDALNQEDIITRYSLPHKLKQTTASGKSPFSFQEVQSRIRHNHLTFAPNGRAVYVDAELRVIAVDFDDVCISSSPPERLAEQEYPSVAFLDNEILFASDGNGTLYALHLQDRAPATLINAFEIPIPPEYESSESSVPFKVHAAVQTSPESCTVVLSSKHYSSVPAVSEPISTKVTKRVSQFDVWAVSVDVGMISQDQPLGLDILWHRRGEDVPLYVHYVESKKAFMLLGIASYHSIASAAPPTYEPSLDEMAPIPRSGECLDPTPAESGATPGPSKPPQYSWTQTTDTVTVAFPLPSSIPKDAIKVTFSPTTLTLLVQSAAENETPVSLPRYALKKFWDGIQPSTSFWTLDREAEHAFGLLTLYLDKQHEGTRWSHLFAPSSTATAATAGGGSSEADVEVPETLDPSELWQIREALEKYTADLQSGGEDAGGWGLGRGMPSLAEGEMDDEVDLTTGDTVALTWVGADGRVPSWCREAGSDDSPFNLLSTPLPGPSGPQPPSLVVKRGLDGVVYTLGSGGSAEDPPTWTHTSTFCVLSFVLASKRDTRFVHHVSDKAVLAFESGARGLGGNVYIYRNTAQKGDNWAKQAILKVSDGSGGVLLGVDSMDRDMYAKSPAIENIKY
ncbi:hypothetical protein PHLCEN_2v9525 [Hermanssonia centrifuga]|uniref:NudC domain-containing protein 1 n=1 Tax=Hermanssonia centrifuga TaxID=98765 RepID=A0A2R6NQM5_9APHY|nr:hypothetical protein PHLCEN_2v9525 [Hermanssonia centrifuga]